MTMNESRRIISDGTIIMDDDRISHVGKSADLSNAPAERVIDAQEMVITPGFVNGICTSHTPTPHAASFPTT